MTLAQLIPLVAQVSVAVIVVCLAMEASPGDLSYLLRRPSLLVRSVLAMNIVMPVIAVGAALVCNLRPQVEVALILLSISPVPPILPKKQGKAGGNVSYAIGLLMVAALVAIVAVPISAAIIGRVLGREVHVPMALVAKTVAFTVIVPLIAGTIVRRLAPSFAERFAKPIATVGTVLVLLAFIPILIGSWRAILAQFGDFTVVAIVAFVLVSLAVGHLLGGPDYDDRTVLALSTASRHPGVALAITGAITTAGNTPLVSSAVLLAFLVGSIVTGPYAKWRKRGQAAVGGPVTAAR